MAKKKSSAAERTLDMFGYQEPAKAPVKIEETSDHEPLERPWSWQGLRLSCTCGARPEYYAPASAYEERIAKWRSLHRQG